MMACDARSQDPSPQFVRLDGDLCASRGMFNLRPTQQVGLPLGRILTQVM